MPPGDIGHQRLRIAVQLADAESGYQLWSEAFDRDLSDVFAIQEEIARPALLEFEIKGKIEKEAEWARLRVEIYDRSKPEMPATSYEDDYLTVGLDANRFNHLSFPILGIVKSPYKVQFMVVGPAKSVLEIKNVTLR